MDVTLEEAFAEACRIIGEQAVADRIRSRMDRQVVEPEQPE